MHKNVKINAFKAAFPHTLPVLASFFFLGVAFGIYMNASGFSFWYPALISLTVFGGSLEFVMVSMLTSAFAPLQTLMAALVIQARHLFYGISMLEKYKGTGIKKLWLIFGMCDESFSINCSAVIPPEVDKGWFMFFVTLLNYLYWFSGSVVGGIAGSAIPFDTKGIEFVMTAMFVAIFVEQWKSDKCHISEMIGLIVTAVCLLIFGSGSFLIPAMLCILLLLTLFRRNIEGSDKA